MKKLTPKETSAPKKKSTMAMSILDNARQKLIKFAYGTILQLYLSIEGQAPNFEEGEEWTVKASDLARNFNIKVEVDCSYLDVEDRIYEKRGIEEIVGALDGAVFLHDEEGEEWDCYDISIEELAGLCNLLEDSYNKRLKELP